MTTVDCPLRKVFTLRRSFEPYRPYTPAGQFQEIRERAGRLKGKFIVEVGLAPEGEPSARILHQLVPVYAGLGLEIGWYTLCEDPAFCAIARRLEAGLRDQPVTLSPTEKERYQRMSETLANQLTRLRPDVLMIHDIGPAGAVEYFIHPPPATIWRCHLDLSAPDPDAFAFFSRFLRRYRTLSFEAAGDIPTGHPIDGRQAIVPGAIDPLALRNQLIPRATARRRLAAFGLDLDRPIVGQIATFNRWSNPLGAVEVFRIARTRVPTLQLVLASPPLTPLDCDAQESLGELRRRIEGESEIHLYLESGPSSALDLSAFQAGCDVVFSLTRGDGWNTALAETMWKRGATVSLDRPGARALIEDGSNGYLAGSISACADRVITLLQDRQRAGQFGARAHDTIAARALLPRLICDELRICEESINHHAAPAA